MATPSKASLSLENSALKVELTCANMLLADLAFDRALWFGPEEFRLAVARPYGPSGGFVLVRENGIASAYFWENWTRDTLAHIDAVITGHDNEHNARLMLKRETIREAVQFIEAHRPK